jgi:RNA ligase (TIGR02306 family)
VVISGEEYSTREKQMPSEHKVTIERISKLEDHPNADRLSLATVLGWQCVVQKDSFNVGDYVIYFPIDSVLPQVIEKQIFGTDSKVKLKKSRVRTIKLRGAISQGLVVPTKTFQYMFSSLIKEGLDVMEDLGVTKYQVPQTSNPNNPQRKATHLHHPDFKKYTKINRVENYNRYFDELDFVDELGIVVTEKLHGTNFRCGWVKRTPKSLMDHLLKWVGQNTIWPGFWDEYEFVYGSHNVQLQEQPHKCSSKHHGGSNVYLDAVEKYDLKWRLRDLVDKVDAPMIIYGEVVGEGVQKNYSYGHKRNDRALYLFDVMEDGIYKDWTEVRRVSEELEVPHVPVVAMTTHATKERLDTWRQGPSCLHPDHKIREGVVVRTMKETKTFFGRGLLKYINPEYLLKKNTEWS